MRARPFWLIWVSFILSVGLTWAATDFDALPLVDNCNRTEAPLSNGAQWTHQVISTFPSTMTADGTVCIRSGTTGFASVWWNAETFGPDVATAALVPDFTSASGTPAWIVYLRLIQPGVASQTDGYSCTFEPALGGGSDGTIGLRRYDNSAGELLSTCTPVSMADGNSIACEMIWTGLKAYMNRGSGWEEECSATDGTYTAAGYSGLSTSQNMITIDNIRMGTLTSPGGLGEPLMPLLQ